MTPDGYGLGGVAGELIILTYKRPPRPVLYNNNRVASKAMQTIIQLFVHIFVTFVNPKSGCGGPSWLTFLGHIKDSLWSVDLFRCESILLRSQWVLVVMDLYTRRIVGFGVHAGYIDGVALYRMFNKIISCKQLPQRISSDNDPLFLYQRWQTNLRILDIKEVKTMPYVPLSHPFIERLNGTIRHEFFDRSVFWNVSNLERKLSEFQGYYNEYRAHSSLNGNTPAEINQRTIKTNADLNNYHWQSHYRGLFQLPLAA